MNKEKQTEILFIISQPFFEWRGSPIRMKYNLLALSELGYKIDFLGIPHGKDIKIDNVTFLKVKNYLNFTNYPIGPSIKKIFYDLFLLLKAIKLIKLKNYKYIHTAEDTGMIGLILSVIFKIKFIYEKHSDINSYKTSSIKNIILYIYNKIEEVVIKYSDAVIGTGPNLCEYANSINIKDNAHHIFDIPSSLKNPDKILATQIAARLKTKDNDILICYVGSFATYQGIELLFDSIIEVIRNNKKAIFVIIGGDDKEIKIRKAFLKKHNIEKGVIFLGKILPDDLPNYLKACDILLSPRIAGFNTPLKLLDYLKVSKPIVATNFKANNQILKDDVALFSSPNCIDFSKKILKLIENEDLRNNMSKNSKKLIDETYNFENFKTKLNKCYESL